MVATHEKEEMLSLVRQEVVRLLTETPAVKYQLIGMLSASFVEKEDLKSILAAIAASREDSNRRFAEFSQRMDELREDSDRRFADFSQRMDELREDSDRRFADFSQRMDELREDFNRGFAEFSQRLDKHDQRMDAHDRRMDELREDFNRGFAEFSRRLDEHDQRMEELAKSINALSSHIGALGARWGMMSESAFREGLAGILGAEFGLKVERYLRIDTEGTVFGRPDQVEIDVVIHDGHHIPIEIKSSTSRNDVYAFRKKVAFYEKEQGVEVKRSIIISPMFDRGARELAQDLGVETYTSAYDVPV